ncbi:sigma-54-dependent transcriptional regulator [Desulfovibrio inopinatus]|uniref:sigma-54-dependent transcriptional regulator n=1 Tax=Desulfovibrio inopinatus TaxID=102109 RepID=UPI000412A2C1|nr:sigma-54 dependent transcriptional regulator [Desulfovibrio inopinatus]
MQKQPVVLVVDDEADFLDSLSERIRLRGMEPLVASSGPDALLLARSHHIDLAVIDLKMPEMDGLVTIAKLREIKPDLKTVLLTGQGNDKERQASEALASGFYEKNDMTDFWSFLRHFQQQSGLVILAQPPTTSMPGFDDLMESEQIEMAAAGKLFTSSAFSTEPERHSSVTDPRLIGETPVMQDLKRNIAKVATLDCTVLIRGETGTGKELVAKAIHRLSPRANKKFLAVNCASFSQELLSNELFGHEKDAFTGASRIKKGLFEAADGGSIMLDEIGDTPLAMQVQLLRVLQEKTVIRIGGTEEIPVDVRVLAATHQSLQHKAERGEFREDLYYRLNAFVLRIPPLRERREDIPLLCSYFLEKYRREFKKNIERFSGDVLEIFMQHPFPGNVRELENAVERAVILCEDKIIVPNHLPKRFQIAPQPVASPALPDKLITLAELEDEYIRKVMQATSGNRNEAAEILGISRSSLWRKLKRLEENG